MSTSIYISMQGNAMPPWYLQLIDEKYVGRYLFSQTRGFLVFHVQHVEDGEKYERFLKSLAISVPFGALGHLSQRY